MSGARYVADGDEVDVIPAGLALIDPGNWSVRRVNDDAQWVTLEGESLLASSWKENSDVQTLAVFTLEGRLRFSRERRAMDLSQAIGSHLYASADGGARYELIDLVNGKTVGRARPGRPLAVLAVD